MGSVLVALSVAAANVAGNGAAKSNSPPPVGLADFLTPAWVLVIGTLAALLIAIIILAAARQKPAAAEKPKSRDGEFAHMLCAQVWTHTDHITGVFAQRLRQRPEDINTLRVLVRLLREDLAGPLHFIRQMQAHPTTGWGDYKVLAAFTQWAGQVESLAAMLADQFQMVTNPLIKEPVDKQGDEKIVYHFDTERFVLIEGVNRTRNGAIAVCNAIKPLLKKEKKKEKSGAFRFGEAGSAEHDEHDDEEHAACPCCKRMSDHHVATPSLPVEIHVKPPPTPQPPPPPPPPAPPVCCCTVKLVCHCQRGCACGCQCPGTPPSKPHG